MKQQNALAWVEEEAAEPCGQNRVDYGNGTLGLSPLHGHLCNRNNSHQTGRVWAVFLAIQMGKNQCAGTGVFLPRRVGNSSEPRKKPAFPAVLVPARVAQALNLNLNEVGAQTQPHHPWLRNGGNRFGNQRLRNQATTRNQSRNPVTQEWTY
ncbi:uncharacterized protein LOC120214094 [Hibiscus syriacus]|uniref:uncharacterized protein LOC120214094 n=1 Tax=Hibiscus syriacus TaxID=106335 RepID=UPI001920A7EC|nr:uncharacterized protein LOC120214094 [Hibiscus syriacus]XP_039068008.1 uncharacterized protein LOC120214094 [Hibiscus syriacus]